MNAIETRSLSKWFGRKQAVDRVDLRIPEGAVFALMGPNGAGKTTLIKMLMNLQDPSSGRAWMLGMESSRLQGRRLEEIGYVSENQKLPEWMTVGGFLAYWRGFYPRWDRELEQRLVREFELPVKQKLKRLSRGMRMKAALASALAYHPRLIVLDEPLSGLDPLVRDTLIAGLLAMRGETTVFFSSHDLAEIESFATHVGYMQEGRLTVAAPMEDLRRRFVRVTVADTGPLSVPQERPAEWLEFASSACSASWSEINFDERYSATRIRQYYRESGYHAAPMNLREIFLTLARNGRKEGGQA